MNEKMIKIVSKRDIGRTGHDVFQGFIRKIYRNHSQDCRRLSEIRNGELSNILAMQTCSAREQIYFYVSTFRQYPHIPRKEAFKRCYIGGRRGHAIGWARPIHLPHRRGSERGCGSRCWTM